jgi:hypothetical protein
VTCGRSAGCEHQLVQSQYRAPQYLQVRVCFEILTGASCPRCAQLVRLARIAIAIRKGLAMTTTNLPDLPIPAGIDVSIDGWQDVRGRVTRSISLT